MITALWIAGGGAVGTLARFGLAGLVNQTSHPWGTVVVNITGSLLLGVLVGLWGVDHSFDHQRALTVGVLGGFTTFSTFAIDTLRLWEDGKVGVAAATVLISVAGGLLAAIGGLAIGRSLAT